MKNKQHHKVQPQRLNLCIGNSFHFNYIHVKLLSPCINKPQKYIFVHTKWLLNCWALNQFNLYGIRIHIAFSFLFTVVLNDFFFFFFNMLYLAREKKNKPKELSFDLSIKYEPSKLTWGYYLWMSECVSGHFKLFPDGLFVPNVKMCVKQKN